MRQRKMFKYIILHGLACSMIFFAGTIGLLDFETKSFMCKNEVLYKSEFMKYLWQSLLLAYAISGVYYLLTKNKRIVKDEE